MDSHGLAWILLAFEMHERSVVTETPNPPGLRRREKAESMTKSIALILDALNSSKPPLRQIFDRPLKHQKHRYERRKVREYLRLGDWMPET